MTGVLSCLGDRVALAVSSSRILLIFVLGLQVKNGYVFERGKCKGVSK